MSCPQCKEEIQRLTRLLATACAALEQHERDSVFMNKSWEVYSWYSSHKHWQYHQDLLKEHEKNERKTKRKSK
jgi:hypothetical protein